MPTAGPTPALAHNLLVAGELRRIAGALEAAGVDFIVLKGVPLALRLTGRLDGRGRRIRDNDILVRRADLTRAVAVVEALGYARPPFSVASQLTTNFQYELFKQVPGGPRLPVEIHWAPFPPLLYPVAEEYVWRQSEVADLGDWKVLVFDKPSTVIHLAAHFVQHGGSVEWILRDLALAWNTWAGEIDLVRLRSLAGEMGLLHVLAFSLRAADDRGLLTVPPLVLRSRRADMLGRLLPASKLCTPRPHPDYVRSLQMLALVDVERIPRWLLLRLVPPRSLLAAQSGLSGGRAVYFEYFRRPFRALVRLVRRGGPPVR